MARIAERTPKKRPSKRRYTGVKCKKTECSKVFNPTDSRQKYCCPQHRVDHNNDQRKIKNSNSDELNKILAKNESVLKKIFNNPFYTAAGKVNKQLLDFEGLLIKYNTDIQVSNDTGGKILWSFHYGLEACDASGNLFTIHYRNQTPFYGSNISGSNNHRISAQ